MFMNAYKAWIAEIATIEASSFCFSPAIDPGHPLRPVRVTAGIDPGDEVLVARKNHDQEPDCR